MPTATNDLNGTLVSSFCDDAHFTAANIPWGIASSVSVPQPQAVTRLYSNVYFLIDLIASNLISGFNAELIAALSQPTLNVFAALPKALHVSLRSALRALFTSTDDHTRTELSRYAHPIQSVTMYLPVSVGDFSDFSTSISHVLNAGEAVLGQRTLPPGFLYFPVGYAGRSSSIVVSGTSIRRPSGYTKDRGSGVVSFGPSKALDFELEVAAIVSVSTKLGEKVPIEEADSCIFGLVLLNDWSARDIQGLEMSPLGPFNGKSFGTSMSAWVVPLEALVPFETTCGSVLPTEDEMNTVGLQHIPQRASYLRDSKARSHYNVNLQVDLMTPGIPSTTSTSAKPSVPTTTTVCRSNLSSLYWSVRDMVAHQTVSGCPLRPGDVLATGTISGPTPGSFGCLLEITKGGKAPVQLNNGSERRYLEDGDCVSMTGWAGTLGEPDCVGFGSCWGLIEAS